MTGTNRIEYHKKGNVVDIMININTPVTISGSPYLLGNLPAGYAPAAVKYIHVYTGSGVSCIFQVTPEGKIVTYMGLQNQMALGGCSYTV